MVDHNDSVLGEAPSSPGVPQGITLGLVLFLVCVNDIVCRFLSLQLIAYADDITILGTGATAAK